MKQVSVSVGSALTVLNAIKSPYGAAIGINISINVSISMVDQQKDILIKTNPQNINHSLIWACLNEFSNNFDITIDNIKISTDSPLPPKSGMKTSSAISCALLKSLSLYYKIPISVEEIVNISAKSSIIAGVSITGAIDDAYASFCGGLSFTDTKRKKLISLIPYNTDAIPVLLLSNTTNPKLQVSDQLLRIDHKLIKTAIRKFRKGDIISAIKFNTLAYAPHLLEEFTIIEELNKKSIITGLNGAGPSLFAFCKKNQVKELEREVKHNFVNYRPIITSIKSLDKDCI